jgi:hypothetical protein
VLRFAPLTARCALNSDGPWLFGWSCVILNFSQSFVVPSRLCWPRIESELVRGFIQHLVKTWIRMSREPCSATLLPIVSCLKFCFAVLYLLSFREVVSSPRKIVSVVLHFFSCHIETDEPVIAKDYTIFVGEIF